MRFGNLADMSGRFARRGLTVAARASAFLLALGVFTAPALEAQGTPAGTIIRSWAVVTYQNELAQQGVATSDTVSLVVGQVAGVDVEAPRVSAGLAGSAIVFAHSLANLGNGPDSFTVAAVSKHGWPVTLYRDRDGDGILGAGDSLLTGPVALGYAGSTHLLARVAIPSSGVLGVRDTVTVTATSRFNQAIGDLVLDRVDIPSDPVAVSLAAQVDRATAVAGDVLTYTLAYDITGGGAAFGVALTDTIPVGTSYVPGTLRWNGTVLSDPAGDDAGGIVPTGNGLVALDLGTLATGTTGSVTFQVRVSSGPARPVDNRSHAIYASVGSVSDTAFSNSVRTSVLVPLLWLDKQLTSPALAHVGEPVTYTLRYGNGAGAAVVSNVVLSDTLPAGLQYVGSTPAASVSGSVLTWALGDLDAGAGGVVDVSLQVDATVHDTVRVQNVARLESQNQPPLSAAAAEVALVGPPSAALGLEYTANVLQVGVGEAIPYTLAVKNTGVVPVSEIRIDTRLPKGARYTPLSAIGADSAVVAGDQLVFFTAAPLAAGGTRAVRYVLALTSAPGTVVETRATASGNAGSHHPISPEAVVWVQVRRTSPMETRAAIGKVWVDTDGDGVQSAGEVGLSGIDIWTEDGQVATTDSTGKFSLSNVRAGRHAFRLDPRSLSQQYRLAGEDIQVVEASGWTTPRIDFRLVPVTPRVAALRQRVDLSVIAAPVHPDTTQSKRAPQPAVPVLRYDVTVHNPSGLPLGAKLALAPLPDSAVVFVADSAVMRYAQLGDAAIPMPDRRGQDVRVLAWAAGAGRVGDSATATLQLGPTALAVRAVIHNPLRPASKSTWVATTLARVPAADSMVPGAELELALEPMPAGWPDVGYNLSAGWRPVAGSVQLGNAPAPDPVTTADGAGRWLRWHFAGAATAPITLRLAAGKAGAADTGHVTVPAARTTAAREEERNAALLRGPGIEIFSPVDGTVLPGDHVYIGVKGEANVPVMLYDGATLLNSVQMRVDGVYDFIAVPLARGPHRLRVMMKNSWGTERWDSIAIHVTGVPAKFEVKPSPLTLVADGRSVTQVDVRVLDQWGVPVVQPAYVTVSGQGVEPVGRDADASSVGVQLLSSTSGELTLALRPGREVGPGVLALKSGDAADTVPLQLLPEVRGLTVAGSGLVGVGASPDAYGAITARGRIDSRTSLTLGVDSRRLNDGRNVFGRAADPLDESQYTILGDASHQQARTASHNWVSARVERGYDWASFGDLSTTDFAKSLTLARYQRSVTGLAARVTTGAMTWSGFGSFTSQSLRQLQIRGAGISGPYELGGDVLPGTEQLRVETRALDNPERIVATQVLTRFVDYQIDYDRGVVLFKQAIPATDARGNPLFIVATFEAVSGGAQRLVAGGRATLDVRQLATGLRVDSLRVGVTAVNASQDVHDYRLVGGDVSVLRVGAFKAGAEVAYADKGDSAGFGGSVKAGYTLFGGAVTAGATYTRLGSGFTNPSNVALRPGTSDLSLKGGLKLGDTELRAEHSHQEFQQQGVDRQHSRVGLVQTLARNFQMDAGVANDQVSGTLAGGSGSSEATAAEFKTKWAPTSKLQLWTEARRHLSLGGQALFPDVWGVGADYKLTSLMSLEASQRFVSRPDSQGEFSLSSLGLRADMGHGSQAWGSYQLSGGMSGAGNAAVLGLRNQVQLRPDLSMNVMFERRMGVSAASVTDPVRALPFLQPEDDYWSAGAGLEFLPKQSPYRLSARGEFKDGTLQSSRLVSVAGDVAFDASLALLSRQEFTQNLRPGQPLSRRLTSLWGLALRPARTDKLNMLAKVQWTNDHNPIGGGVLVSEGAERKAIGAAEVIWTPIPKLELGTRYAVRHTEADRVYTDGTPQTLTSWAEYTGGHANYDLTRWLSVRGDARVLVEQTTNTQTWDGAPALAFRPVNGLEFATGYRFGNLSDPDFSVRGGHGAFVTLSAALTEKMFPTAAEFWRRRF
ncbi:MAG TPA: hypothetical protein VIW28_07735 [Gemmatimonadales bacterium]